MEKREWFTLADAAGIWGAKDGIAGMVHLILKGNSDFERLTASYFLPSPWKAYYIKRIEEPSADKEKCYSLEVKEIWRVDIEVRGLINLYFSGECCNADGSVTIRGDGSIKSPDGHWPERAKVYVTLPDSYRSSSLHLISTGETPEELQDCLNIEPEHDLIVTRSHLEDFARMIGRSSVLTKLKTLPPSGNVAACEILIEYESRMDIERKPQQAHVVFDATKSTKKYRVAEGYEPVRLASTSGHVVMVGEEPRHIPVGFEQEALVKGCITIQSVTQNTQQAESKPDSAKKKTAPAPDISAKMSALKKDKIKANSKTVDKFLATYLKATGHKPSDNNELMRHMRTNPNAYPLAGFSKDDDPEKYFYLKSSSKTKREYYNRGQILRIIKARLKSAETSPEKIT